MKIHKGKCSKELKLKAYDLYENYINCKLV